MVAVSWTGLAACRPTTTFTSWFIRSSIPQSPERNSKMSTTQWASEPSALCQDTERLNRFLLHHNERSDPKYEVEKRSTVEAVGYRIPTDPTTPHVKARGASSFVLQYRIEKTEVADARKNTRSNTRTSAVASPDLLMQVLVWILGRRVGARNTGDSARELSPTLRCIPRSCLHRCVRLHRARVHPRRCGSRHMMHWPRRTMLLPMTMPLSVVVGMIRLRHTHPQPHACTHARLLLLERPPAAS